MRKLGFCFLTHQAHVRHQLPIALAYAKNNPHDQVDIIVTSKDVLEEIMRGLGELVESNLNINFLRGSCLKSLVGRIKGRLYPNVRDVINRNKDTFLSYDILVTPHHTLDRVMELDRNRRIKYVCTFHGAGDGEIGFHRKFSNYDLLLVSGKDVYERLISSGILHSNNRGEIIGYPKLEGLKVDFSNLFNNDNTICMYNPHYTNHLTSWNEQGESVLKWFSEHPEYNLIFAPHVKLFDGKLPDTVRRYLSYSNIHIDIDSPRLMDATYTNLADIYIGDVSSQVYETLYFSSKPMIFFNSHCVRDWREDPNYYMWVMGDVVEDIDEFEGALINSSAAFQDIYKKIQEDILKSRFSKEDKPAPDRGAEAIAVLRDSL